LIKILEFLAKNDIQPVGGPCGYVYNLISNYKSDNICIELLPNNDNDKVGHELPKFFKDCLSVIFKYKLKSIYEGVNYEGIDFNQYDFIHFHSTIHFFMARKVLENYSGKTILTNHSPKPTHIEVYEDQFSSIERFGFGKRVIDEYKKIDEYAFNTADYILFPCQESEEAYYTYWNEYFKIASANKSKYIYMLSGVIQKKPCMDITMIREKLQLDNYFTLCYAGRHIETKGYDLLKKYAKKILSKDKDIKFLICGKEEPMRGLNDSRWIEIGWTKDVDSYIASADIFVLPNKETYFDLVLLEVLSLGKIIVTSRTGGNKYFENQVHKGIFLYDTEEEFFDIVYKIKSMTREERKWLGDKNREMYESMFDEKSFWNRYESILMELSK